jgi:hypothetical protein
MEVRIRMGEEPDRTAERIELRTQRILWAAGFAFVAWQLAFFALYSDGIPTGRLVDKVRSIAFIACCAMLLLLIATGGGLLRGRKVRELLDDELARARRATAYRNGFWTMILIALAGYVVAQLTTISALGLAHAGASGGVLAAVVTLAYTGRG